jgi:hypothetical protein
MKKATLKETTARQSTMLDPILVKLFNASLLHKPSARTNCLVAQRGGTQENMCSSGRFA